MTTKKLILIVGDLVVFFLSLLARTLIREGEIVWVQTVTFAAATGGIWGAAFYLVGLYDLRALRNSYDVIRLVGTASMWATLFSVIPFYFFPLSITPKANLFLFSAIFFCIVCIWRVAFHLLTRKPERRVLIVGKAPEIEELTEFLGRNPQVGYEIVEHVDDFSQIQSFQEYLEKNAIHSLFLHSIQFEHPDSRKKVALAVAGGREVRSVEEVVEILLKKLVVLDSSSHQLMQIISLNQRIYGTIKRSAEQLVAAFVLLCVLPLMAVITLLIWLTAGRPAIYRQTRLGKNLRSFTMYKFRTMVQDAEKDGARWAHDGDSRVTPFGKLLRRTHLDELPQLFNIVKGDMSFVGPRPERPEFRKLLEAHIPFYAYRHLVRPGITGWAQINYPYGSSVEDAFEKIRYDLYYIKNRSFIFDIIIFFKSFQFLFVRARQ